MGSYRFVEGREFDAASGELHRDGTTVRLEPQPATFLTLLASHAGNVVSHADIRHAIWGDDTHVNFQDSVHYCVRQVRSALGDRAQAPRFIETIPRRGYRLRADAILPPPPEASARLAEARFAREGGPAESAVLPAVDPTPAPSPVAARRSVAWRRHAALVCLGTLLAAATAFVEHRPNNHHQIAVAILKTVHNLVF